MPFFFFFKQKTAYEISDYRSVNPTFGTLDDFKVFLDAAHQHGIRVIIEMVLNHTSDQHPWFQESRSSRDNPRRDWYVWSDTDTKYKGTRIIFLDTELSNWAWDPVSKQYYWHRFFSHQPDLNYDNPQVREEMWNVMKFWLEMGVDGFRLDAVPYLMEREGTNCENLPETHGVIKELRARLDHEFPGRMLLAEANQWPSDLRAYFGNGDEFHMAFHFPLMPRMFMGVKLGDRNGVRTPMQWDGGWNGGFSAADPEVLYSPLMLNPVYGYQAINVQSQKRFDHSLLSWTKQLIRVRKSSPVLGRGSIEFLYPANHRVLAYLRKLGNETVLIVNNLSSKAQALELDLKAYRGNILVEMFGRNIFPRIGELPYLLTLGPYQFYWFRLRRV